MDAGDGADDPPGRSVGQLVRDWRRRALLTQEQLAERARLSVRTIRRLESGDPSGRPHSSSLQMLAAALDLGEADRAVLAAAIEPGAGAPVLDRPVPRQLPATVHGFVGRDDDIARLDEIMGLGGGAGDSAPIVISAIDGTAGIGKTALAVHWAHRVQQHFPDGQLYLDLRGYGPGLPVAPEDALAVLLRAAGVVDPDLIPAGVDERSALLRSTLAGRRVLIVLDNAKDSEQVRPLLPGSGGLVVVTSRRKLRALSVRHGARHLTVDLLPELEALELLAAAIGRDRVDGEPEAAAAIVELCARLPLALRLAAERVDGRPATSLRELAAELAGHRDRLAALSIEESADTDLRSVFAWSHAALDPEAAEMFDLFGVHPASSTSVPAAAATAGVPVARAAATLQRLADAHLLEQRFRGRFEPHDLLREYARDRAVRGGVDHGPARARLLQWYVHSAAAARAQIAATPHQLPVAARPPDGVAPERFESHGAAMEWFDAELDTILKIILTAGDGHHADAAVLGQLVWYYLYLRGLWQQMREVGEAGVEHARAAGDRLLEAKIRNGLSMAYERLPGCADAVIATSRQALSIFVELGSRRGQAGCLLNLGSSYRIVERFDEAQDALERAHDLYVEDGDELYAAFALNNLAGLFLGLDRFDEALSRARRAVDVLRGNLEPFRLVTGLMTLAAVHAARGEGVAALRRYREAVATAEAVGSTHEVIHLGLELGHRLSAAGAPAEAMEVWREAHRICLEHDDPAIGEIERLLGRCPGQTYSITSTAVQPASSAS